MVWTKEQQKKLDDKMEEYHKIMEEFKLMTIADQIKLLENFDERIKFIHS